MSEPGPSRRSGRTRKPSLKAREATGTLPAATSTPLTTLLKETITTKHKVNAKNVDEVKAQLTELENRINESLEASKHQPRRVGTPKTKPARHRVQPTQPVPSDSSSSDETSSGLLVAGTQPPPAPPLQQPEIPSPYTKSAGAVLPPQGVSAEDRFESVMRSLVGCLSLSRLPVAEPPVFTGDPLSFADWSAQFNTLVDAKPLSNPEKLQLLRNYLSGPAKEAVEALFLLCDPQAYDQARDILQKRFGHPLHIANAFRDKIEFWPEIAASDKVGLRRYADFLRQCQVAKGGLPELAILDDIRENKKMAAKIPTWLARKWARKVAKQSALNQYPNFNDFVAYIQQETDIACDPVASTIGEREPVVTRDTRDNPNRDRTRHITNRAQALHTQGVEHTKTNKASSCMYCHARTHQTPNCPKLIEEGLSESKAFIKRKGLCFICLESGHLARDCQNRVACLKCSECHATCLHGDERPPAPPNLTSHRVTRKNATPGLTSMILPVYVSSGVGHPEVLTYALLDTQSDATFVQEDLVNRLDTQKQPTTLNLATMTNSQKRITCHKHSGLRIRGLQSHEWVVLPDTYERPFIPANRQHIPTPKTAEQHPHLKHIAHLLSPLKDVDVQLLVGYNCPRALAPLQSLVGEGASPYAVRTPLGWTIVGGQGVLAEGDAIGVSHRCMTSPEVSVISRTSVKEVPYTPPHSADIIRALNADFADPSETCGPRSIEDARFLKVMEEGLSFDKQGFCTLPLPLRDSPRGENGLEAARNRFRSLERRLRKDPDEREQYHAFMKGVIDNGEAEIVPKSTSERNTDCWYIPHFAVRHPQKRKLRVVFDCAARSRNGALNDHLLQGPDLLNSLTGILMRFRTGPVAITCDIKAMFHQFRVCIPQRDYLRFLWYDDEGLVCPYRMCVHLFGAVSSPACATYGLRQIVGHFSEPEDVGAVGLVTRDFYVDDGLISAPSEAEAFDIYTRAKRICSKANVNLHKVLSNSKAIMSQIPVEDRGASTAPLDLAVDELPIERTLGVQWDLETDEFLFAASKPRRPFTRRGLLSTVMAIYDPLGFVAPCVLEGKAILQEMCRRQATWDEPLDADLLPRWESWLAAAASIVQVRIPRYYFHCSRNDLKLVELHTFSDASERGYGACSYIRGVSNDGQVQCALVSAKARVASLKSVSIPRLELQAAVVAARMAKVVQDGLKVPMGEMSSYFWSDSMVVLGWIRNEARRFHTYVANRVQQVHDLTDPNDWYHVRSEENPADVSSRGSDARSLLSSIWFQGPSFLHQQVVVFPPAGVVQPEGMPEARISHAVQTAPSEPTLLEQLARLSLWKKMVGVVSVMQRWVRRSRGHEPASVVEEWELATRTIYRFLQEEHLSDSLPFLRKGKQLPRHSQLTGLDPFIDEYGVVRVGGRLRQAGDLDEKMRHPIILSRRGPVVKRLVEHYHNQHHQGRTMTLTALRSNGIWVLGARVLVSTVIHACVVCRRTRAPCQQQKMAELPRDRIDPSPPFTHSGCDVFGPFHVKEGRKEVKRYALMVTCLASRAVHIEALEDMSSDAFINAYRRVESIRGPIHTLRCDRGTNFVGACGVFERAVKQGLGGRACDFTFNPPNASHFGGVWERMIRSARSILTGLLSQSASRMNSYSFQTVLYEVANTMNSHPLCAHETEDPHVVPLSPNTLLQHKLCAHQAPPGEFQPREVYAAKRWRQVQAIAEQFWHRWRGGYLSDMQSRKKWQKSRGDIKEGAVVLVADENTPRGDWRMAIVDRVKVSADGLVRSATVRMANTTLGKEGKAQGVPSVLERPIHKLVELVPGLSITTEEGSSSAPV